ncbi:MAG: RNA 2',3'-cyclic phosphodiesterase [Nitrososphaeria archaeon]|nr:RNA 2',3'-cyclic phosphodiesterase [Nitrososphaeria archaeon]
MIRTFIALDLEDGLTKKRILEVQKEILAIGVDAKPVEPENLHFTIKFLGEIEESKVSKVIEVVSRIEFEPIKVKFRGLGAFPSLSHVNVVWVGVDKDAEEAMTRLWNSVERELEKNGFPRERKFEPHMTIMRIKSGLHKQELAAKIREYEKIEFGEEILSKLKVKKSVLTKDGPIYYDLYVTSK